MNYGLLFWAEQFITSGLCAVLQATIPAFGLIFAHFLLSDERLTPLKVAGVSVGLLGVAVIFSGELHLAGRQALWGCAAVIVGAASTSFVNVLIKQRGQGFDPAVLANGQMVFGFLPLLALGWTVEGAPWRYHWTGQAVFDLFYLALLGSSLAFCLLYWLVRRVEVTRIMLISLVTPVAAVLIGAATLHEKLAGGSLLGGILVMSGMGLVVYRRANGGVEEARPAAQPIPAGPGGRRCDVAPAPWPEGASRLFSRMNLAKVRAVLRGELSRARGTGSFGVRLARRGGGALAGERLARPAANAALDDGHAGADVVHHQGARLRVPAPRVVRRWRGAGGHRLPTCGRSLPRTGRKASRWPRCFPHQAGLARHGGAGDFHPRPRRRGRRPLVAGTETGCRAPRTAMGRVPSGSW